MLFNPNIFTTEEVLEYLEAAKLSLKEGKSVVSFSSVGTSATMQWDISPLRMIEECTRYLQKVDPDTYGPRLKTGRILHGD